VRTILLVCHANTARSVMAQALLERILAEREVIDGIHIRSGGIAPYARDGMLPSLDARIVLREVGIDLGEEDLLSTDLKRHRHLVAEANLIVTMTGQQRQMVEGFAEARGRPVLTLRELAGEEGDIADPATQGEESFRACRDEISRCLERSVDRLLLALSPEHAASQRVALAQSGPRDGGVPLRSDAEATVSGRALPAPPGGEPGSDGRRASRRAR